VETRILGTSGIEISRVVLGCGSFGGIGSAPAFFGQGSTREEAFSLLDAAWELGITTLDTADAYGGGRSEAFIGAWLASRAPAVRERVVVTTKTFNPMTAGADSGLAGARVRRQARSSLERLGLEHIPLYMVHDYDPSTPQEETLAALDELVRAGLVGAIGASNFPASRLAEALALSHAAGHAAYAWVQNEFSLLERRDREAMLGLCRAHGLGYTPFSPLAGGWLTGKYRRGEPPPPGSRMTKRPEGGARFRTDAVFDGLERFEAYARDRDATMAALALAWLLHVPEVTAVVIGPSRVEQLDPVREALALTLADGERDELESLFALEEEG